MARKFRNDASVIERFCCFNKDTVIFDYVRIIKIIFLSILRIL